MSQWKLWVALGGGIFLWVGEGVAQDVFLGGTLDLETVVENGIDFELGREAGLNLTFALEDRVEVFFNYNLAGGRERTIEFYATLPRLRDQVALSIGRLRPPFGLPFREPRDAYVAGAPDFFDSFSGYRAGNVFLDTYGEGLSLAQEFRGLRVEATLLDRPRGKGQNIFLRLRGLREDWQPAWSFFRGKDGNGNPTQWQGPAIQGRLGPTVEGGLEFLWGRQGGQAQQALYAELRQDFPAQALRAFFKLGTFGGEQIETTATAKIGARRLLDPFSYLEARYEWNDAAGPAGAERFVLGYTVKF